MKPDKKVEMLVRNEIEKDHRIGDHAGGSGHLSEQSYEITDISVKSKNKRFRIDYTYTLYITTEFTYYPDNPPEEYFYSKSLLIENGKCIDKKDL